MRTFIVASSEGQTFDSCGRALENMQILDFLRAADLAQAQTLAARNLRGGLYGAFTETILYPLDPKGDPFGDSAG